MAKQKKNNHSDILPVPREAIAAVRGEEDFVELLRRELEWPIPMTVQRLADVAIPHDLQKDFGFKPEEDRIAVSRLLNLTEDQPWGVFLFEFKTKRPYLSHLRRLLRILGSQRTLRGGDPIWNRSDLLFICTTDWSQFHFVHFSGEKPESAIISTFGWKGPDDPFLYTLCKHNLPRLRMPQPTADGNYDDDIWRTVWRDAFSVKPVTDEFYATLKEVFDAVQSGVKGLKGEDRRFFAELVVNRMVFLKFVEKKGWLDGDRDYLYNRFQVHGRKNYWRNFLCDFFFEGLCKEKNQRSKKVNELLGNVPFLNAELFAPSDKWDDWAVEIENRVFDLLFDKLLNPYNFTVCETSPLDVEVAFNQDLLGYGYEELIADQHGQGAYYTHPTEVNLMCRESLRAYLEGRCPLVNKELIGKLVYAELTNADPISEKDALTLYRALHDVTVVDPALGSGTFPVAMMKHLFLALRTLGGYLKKSVEFGRMLKQDGITDPEDAFTLKLHIIERSIYGCDIDYFAVQIAKLRFWIELMVDCNKPEALPNFNCKLVVGDALVSVVGTDNKGNLIILEDLLGHPTRSVGQGNWIHLVGKQSVEKLANLKRQYFKVRDAKERKSLEDQISKTHDELLRSVGVQPEKIEHTNKHILWQIDFAEVFTGDNPGFDIAIANPPYLRQELIDSAFHSMALKIDKKQLRSLYNKLAYKVDGKADLYAYFYIRAFMLLRRFGGVLTFICSNTWLDVAFGECLREQLIVSADHLIVFDSSSNRSFESADINTIIAAVRLGKQAFSNKAIFIDFQSAFSDPVVSKVVHNITNAKEGLNPKNILARHVNWDALNSKEKWGALYLRCPPILEHILSKKAKLFVQLSNVARVRFGVKTGCNEFFHLSRQRAQDIGIAPKYLKPFIKSPRDSASIALSQSAVKKYLFWCMPEGELAPGRNELAYIETGINRRYNLIPSCASRNPWWSLGEREAPKFICPASINDCFKVFENGPGLYADKRLYDVTTQYPIILALMNSSLFWLQLEIFSRVGLGEGLLDITVYEIAQCKIPSPCVKDKITLSKHLLTRRVMPIEEELKTDERKVLDAITFDALGLTQDERDAVYEALLNRVKSRSQKARSV